MLALLITLPAVLVIGVAWRLLDGRLRSGRTDRAVSADVWAGLGVALGERGALVQFSTAFCQPCRAAHHVLSRVATEADGVTHVDIDAESNLEVVRLLGISSTPTTLILDGAGRERFRATGVPRVHQVRAALGLGAEPAAGVTT